MGKKQYNVRLEKPIGDAIEDLADREGISESDAHRELLRRGIAHEDHVEDIRDRLDEIEAEMQSSSSWLPWR